MPSAQKPTWEASMYAEFSFIGVLGVVVPVGPVPQRGIERVIGMHCPFFASVFVFHYILFDKNDIIHFIRLPCREIGMFAHCGASVLHEQAKYNNCMIINFYLDNGGILKLLYLIVCYL
jgi:hypothetical protein